MSLYEYKLKSLGDKIRENEVELEAGKEITEEDVDREAKVKEVKKRRLNK